ncbi:MAG: PIN domain-containing protein [Polyangiaceae bacterium]|nr:PIN domain-containing protein [Polyangiaceae bacterium]
MTLTKIVLDTNIYVDWLNKGSFEELMLGRGLMRYMSAVVRMELQVGAKMLPARRAVDQLVRAYDKADRMLVPGAEVFDEAGRVLRRLRDASREVRRASLVNDVLVALSARSIGATVVTMDADFNAIAEVIPFQVKIVPPE